MTSFVLTVVLQVFSQLHLKLPGDTYNRKKKMFSLDLIFMALRKLKRLAKIRVYKDNVISGKNAVSDSSFKLKKLATTFTTKQAYTA